MRPKHNTKKKEPSERTRNLRNGVIQRESAVDAEADGKARVNAQIAAIAQRTSGGISKSKPKKLTTKQRKRREQMMEKASAFSEKIEKKTDEYNKSQENIKERAKDWDQVNEHVMNELFESDERIAKLVHT